MKIKNLLKSSITGGAVATGLYSATSTFGVASTGTAISTLSGAAATKATLAALGGGTLAAGGGGIVGGTLVLGAAVIIPMVWVYHKLKK